MGFYQRWLLGEGAGLDKLSPVFVWAPGPGARQAVFWLPFLREEITFNTFDRSTLANRVEPLLASGTKSASSLVSLGQAAVSCQVPRLPTIKACTVITLSSGRPFLCL